MANTIMTTLLMAVGLPILASVLGIISFPLAIGIGGVILLLMGLAGHFGKARGTAITIVGGIMAVIAFLPGVIPGVELPQTLSLAGAQPQTEEKVVPTDITALRFSCGDSPATTLTQIYQSIGNTTGSETFSATAHLFEVAADGTLKAANSSTSGQFDVNCGTEYVSKILGEAGDGGDNSIVEEVLSSTGVDNVRIEDGNVRFVVTSPNPSLRLGVFQHGTLEFRMFNNIDNGFACNSDDSCTDFESQGVIFESTTNGTALAVGTNDEIDFDLEIRTTRDDTEANDRGTCILQDAPTTEMADPTVRLDGELLTDAEATLSENTKREYGSTFEHFFCFNKKIRRTPKTVLNWNQFALSGVNPSTDLNWTIIHKTQFLSVNGVDVLSDFVDDTSNTNEIHKQQSFVLDIS